MNHDRYTLSDYFVCRHADNQNIDEKISGIVSSYHFQFSYESLSINNL